MGSVKSGRNEFRLIVAATILISLLCILLMLQFGGSKPTEIDRQPSQDAQGTAVPRDGMTSTEVFTGKTTNTSAMGRFQVDGRPDTLANASEQTKTGSDAKVEVAGPAIEVQIQRGSAVYRMTCFGCHQTDGQGIPDRIPPLAKSDFLLTNTKGSIRNVLLGCTGELVVNGKTYKGTMLPLYALSDDNVANVLTYARNSWGNSGEPVTVEEVAKIRRESGPPPAQAE